jgi:hypothetical protein
MEPVSFERSYEEMGFSSTDLEAAWSAMGLNQLVFQCDACGGAARGDIQFIVD